MNVSRSCWCISPIKQIRKYQIWCLAHQGIYMNHLLVFLIRCSNQIIFLWMSCVEKNLCQKNSVWETFFHITLFNPIPQKHGLQGRIWGGIVRGKLPPPSLENLRLTHYYIILLIKYRWQNTVCYLSNLEGRNPLPKFTFTEGSVQPTSSLF